MLSDLDKRNHELHHEKNMLMTIILFRSVFIRPDFIRILLTNFLFFSHAFANRKTDE